jgi:hypothetical protein
MSTKEEPKWKAIHDEKVKVSKSMPNLVSNMLIIPYLVEWRIAL